MTGRGTNVNKKRHSSQPPGGAAKDSIAEAEAEEDSPLQINANANVDDSSTWSQVAGRGGRRGVGSFATANRFGLLAQADSYPDKTMKSASVSSRGSRRGARNVPETC